jgi:hypothetical protein
MPYIEPLPAKREDAELYLRVLRVAARFRNPENGRRHFAHEKVFRPAFVRRLVQLRRALRDGTYTQAP